METPFIKPEDYNSNKYELICLTRLKTFMEADVDFQNAP